jgi:hypothetical protein
LEKSPADIANLHSEADPMPKVIEILHQMLDHMNELDQKLAAASEKDRRLKKAQRKL